LAVAAPPLPPAGAATSPLLATALVQLLRRSTPTPQQARASDSWGAHPFCEALAAHAGSGPALLEGAAHMLADAACADRSPPPAAEAGAVAAAWVALEPFLACVLLHQGTQSAVGSSDLAAAACLLRPAGRASLTRLAAEGAASTGDAAATGWHRLTERLVPLLQASMIAGGMAGDGSRSEAAAVLADLCDICEEGMLQARQRPHQHHQPAAASSIGSSSSSVGWWEEQCATLAAAALLLATSLAARRESVACCLPIMQRLEGLQPGLFGPQAHTLAGLVGGAASTLEQAGLAAVLASAGASRAAGWHPAQAALMLPPLLPAAVLATSPDSKRWAMALLSQALPALRRGGGAAPPAAATQPGVLRGLAMQGRLAMQRQAQLLLEGMWARGPAAGGTPAGGSSDAQRWLAACASAAAAARRSAAAASPGHQLPGSEAAATDSEAAAAQDAADLSVGAVVVAALALHEEPQVRAAPAPCHDAAAAALAGAHTCMVHDLSCLAGCWVAGRASCATWPASPAPVAGLQVVAAAGAALAELLLAAPMLGPALLPVLLHALRRTQGAGGAGGRDTAR
jgi:hypothetical protein